MSCAARVMAISAVRRSRPRRLGLFSASADSKTDFQGGLSRFMATLEHAKYSRVAPTTFELVTNANYAACDGGKIHCPITFRSDSNGLPTGNFMMAPRNFRFCKEPSPRNVGYGGRLQEDYFILRSGRFSQTLPYIIYVIFTTYALLCDLANIGRRYLCAICGLTLIEVSLPDTFAQIATGVSRSTTSLR